MHVGKCDKCGVICQNTSIFEVCFSMLLDVGVIDLINLERGHARLSASEHVPVSKSLIQLYTAIICSLLFPTKYPSVSMTFCKQRE